MHTYIDIGTKSTIPLSFNKLVNMNETFKLLDTQNIFLMTVILVIKSKYNVNIRHIFKKISIWLIEIFKG